MNNEIKEILDKLKSREETYQFCKQYKLSVNDWIYEAHYLLDYITNLQQEIKEANDSVTWWNNRYEAVVKNCDETVKKMIALGEENERLKKDVELFKSDLISCTNTGLSLITKIDKAIEYINKHKEQLHHSFDEPDCDYWIATNPDDLLNILQNGSDEE